MLTTAERAVILAQADAASYATLARTLGRHGGLLDERGWLAATTSLKRGGLGIKALSQGAAERLQCAADVLLSLVACDEADDGSDVSAVRDNVAGLRKQAQAAEDAVDAARICSGSSPPVLPCSRPHVSTPRARVGTSRGRARQPRGAGR